MNFKAFDYTINIVAYKKNDRDYAFTCAWAMQVDYDKIVFLAGAQSVTGNNIKVNDIIGVSALSIDQAKIALKIGENHSNEINKLKNIDINLDGNAITIKNAKNEMIVEVIDIIKLKELNEDNLVYGRIIKYNEIDVEFLHMSDLS